MATYNLELNDLIQTNLWMRLYGQVCINTFHWIYTPDAGPTDGPTTLGNLNTELSINAGWYYQKLFPRVTTDLFFAKITSQKIKPSRWRAETFILGTNGTNVGTPMPPNVAVSLERWPVESRRGVTGRVSVPGIVKEDEDQGELTLASHVAWQIVADTLKTTISLPFQGDFTPVLAHITPTGFSINEVVGAAAKVETRVMRRRTVGRGI